MRRKPPVFYADEQRQVTLWADPQCEEYISSLISGEETTLWVKNETDKQLMFIPSFDWEDVQIIKTPSVLEPHAIQEFEFVVPDDGTSGLVYFGFQIEEMSSR